MPFCSNCGSPLKDGISFCGQCGTPVKRDPRADYQRRKAAVIDEYNHLAKDNPFAPGAELRDKWYLLQKKIEEVGLQSKQFSDEDGLKGLKRYAEDAKQRSESYAFEVEYDDYKEKFYSLCWDYRMITDYDDPLWEDLSAITTKFETFYETVMWLANNYNKFKNYDVDGRLLRDIQQNIAFYYCCLLLYCSNSKNESEDYWSALEINRKCSNVAIKFNEPRFKVLAGNAYFRQVINIQNLNDNGKGGGGYDEIQNCIRRAMNSLTVLDNLDYCSKVVLKSYSDYRLYDWEWEYLRTGFYCVFSLCEYNRDLSNLDRYYNVIIKAIKHYPHLFRDEYVNGIISGYSRRYAEIRNACS